MKNLIVTLGEAKGDDLIRVVKEERLKNTFGSLVSYMLENEEDELNKPYDNDKLRTVNMIKDAYDNSALDNQFVLTYISSTDNSAHKVQLDEIVGNKKGIIHEFEEIFGDAGTEYNSIQLSCSYTPVAGK